jgi:hypothetical protein
MEYPAIIDEAKTILTTKGWCQNALTSTSGACCMMQALLEASDHRDIEPIVRAIITITIRPPTKWNDEEGRTVEQVLSLLDTVKESMSK